MLPSPRNDDNAVNAAIKRSTCAPSAVSPCVERALLRRECRIDARIVSKDNLRYPFVLSLVSFTLLDVCLESYSFTKCGLQLTGQFRVSGNSTESKRFRDEMADRHMRTQYYDFSIAVILTA
jgi:hypothetical protein